MRGRIGGESFEKKVKVARDDGVLASFVPLQLQTLLDRWPRYGAKAKEAALAAFVAREDRTRLLAGVTDEELAITAKVLKLLTDRIPQTPERSDA